MGFQHQIKASLNQQHLSEFLLQSSRLAFLLLQCDRAL